MHTIYNYDTGKREPLTTTHMEEIRDHLLNARVTNYGYTVRDFRRIQRQRYRAKASLMSTPLAKWRWENLWGRWAISRGRVIYTVGQSENEELTNQMRRLDPRVKKDGWVS